jgi:exodeoxyribonuclease VII large subunit
VNQAVRVNSPELTVSELSNSLKRTLEDAYGYVRVRGELGKVSYHSNGHVYLDLKDDKACIAGVVWRTAAARIRLKLETGLEVVATGRITTYPGRSQYQLIIETVEPAGLGALMALMEERKRKLAAEGLFDAARKRPLPFLPEVIGVVTSPTGAVIRDILHRLADRFPRHVLVWPVRVQGEGSAEQVSAAIRGFNAFQPQGRLPRPDLLIVARGGGSLEDLWSFNDEAVVRAAAESRIPLIAAVGHETDVTLIDFAADKRAPTPTAAAEMAVPVRAELMTRIDTLARRGFACWSRGQERRRTELRGLARALPGPDRLLGERRQRLDLAAARLSRGLRANAQAHHHRFARADAKLSAHSPRAQVARTRQHLDQLLGRLHACRRRGLDRAEERFRHAGERLRAAARANRDSYLARTARDRAMLNALYGRLAPAMDLFLDRRWSATERASELLAAFSYHGVLARGFALVRDAGGAPVRSAAKVSPGAVLDVQFSDGRVGVMATGGVRPAAPPSPGRYRRRRFIHPGQGSLFES